MSYKLLLSYLQETNLSSPWVLVSHEDLHLMEVCTNMCKLARHLVKILGDDVGRGLVGQGDDLHSRLEIPLGKEGAAMEIIVRHLYSGK